jgi:hypothetical protein
MNPYQTPQLGFCLIAFAGLVVVAGLLCEAWIFRNKK